LQDDTLKAARCAGEHRHTEGQAPHRGMRRPARQRPSCRSDIIGPVGLSSGQFGCH
jgi:hypothetical protein